MVGGIVVGLARRGDGTTLLNVQDRHDTCSVRCREGEHRVVPGDSVWWQCGKVYWTPQANVERQRETRCHVDWDIPLEKVGYSH